MEWYWFLLTIIILLIAIIVVLYRTAKTNDFDGFMRLPQFFDEKVYSFFYQEEQYPDFNLYGLSPKSKIYTVINPIDKVETSYFYFPALNAIPDKKIPLLIFLRGNGVVQYRLNAIAGIQDRCNVDVIFVCYRGSFENLSHDQPCRSRINSDNEVVWKDICKRFDFDEYYVYGLSIGSGIATQFVYNRVKAYKQNYFAGKSCNKRLQGVILDNVFSSLDSSFVWTAINSDIDEVKYVPEWALSAFSQGLLAFCGEVYPNLKIWQDIRKLAPLLNLLVFSSGKDKIMPPMDGKLVAETMRNSRFVLVEEADHGSVSDHAVFYSEIANFIKLKTC